MSCSTQSTLSRSDSESTLTSSRHGHRTLTAEDKTSGDSGRFFPVQYACKSCGKTAHNMKSCSQCWWAKYCDRTCQANHWKQHKLECKKDPGRRLYYKGGQVVELDMAMTNECTEAAINEGALFLDLDKCPKNGHNDHASFIPVRDITLDKLPTPIRFQEVLDYIVAEAKTTVRLLAKWTSNARPDTDACASFRGKRYARTASGTYLLDNPDKFHLVPCPIRNCHRAKDLGPSHQVYEGDLKIFTNKHVLYDEEELAKSVVDFFYDSADKKGVIREYPTKLFYTKPSSDKTFLKVTVHDEELLRRMQQYIVDRAVTFNRLSSKVLDLMSSFAIVISHPHGMPKKISVGRILRVTKENVSDETMSNAWLAGRLERKWFRSRTEEDYVNYMKCLREKDLPVYKVWYNSATCQGSSGGPVLFGARKCEGVWGPFIGTHAAYDIDTGLNFFKVVRFA